MREPPISTRRTPTKNTNQQKCMPVSTHAQTAQQVEQNKNQQNQPTNQHLLFEQADEPRRPFS
jgi:hypothetical protein